jgi:hypothetical protein
MNQGNKIIDSNGIAYKNIGGTFYHFETSDKVVAVLETARNNHERIHIRLGDVETGKDWNDLYDVTGYIGRSTGPIKIPLLVHNIRSMGGGALLDHCIVKIVTTKGKRVLYQHEKYHQE